MNVERLQKLADWLRRLPKEKFDFSTVVEHGGKCGTIGCAIGWTPAVFPELVEWNSNPDCCGVLEIGGAIEGLVDFHCDLASRIFDISAEDAYCLFTPDNQYDLGLKRVGEDATPSEVADLIEAYIELKS